MLEISYPRLLKCHDLCLVVNHSFERFIWNFLCFFPCISLDLSPTPTPQNRFSSWIPGEKNVWISWSLSTFRPYTLVKHSCLENGGPGLRRCIFPLEMVIIPAIESMYFLLPVGVFKNMGKPPKSSILIGFSIIFTIHFGGKPLGFFGNIHVSLPETTPSFRFIRWCRQTVGLELSYWILWDSSWSWFNGQFNPESSMDGIFTYMYPLGTLNMDKMYVHVCIVSMPYMDCLG